MTAPEHLQRIKLEGFRSIRSMDLVLSPLNVLVGANGAGKSNFISFFKFMNRLLDRQLQLYVSTELNGADRALFFGRKTTQELAIDLQFSGTANGYRATLAPRADDRLVFSSEWVVLYGVKKYIDLTDVGALESELQSTLKGVWNGQKTSPTTHPLVEPTNSTAPSSESGFPPVAEMYGFLQGWTVYHFHDTSSTAKVKAAYSIHATTRLMAYGENLAAFLYGIQNTDRQAYDRIVHVIQRVAPFFHDFIFEPETNDLIRLRWKHKGSVDYFDATMLSDGTLRFICLATLLLQPKPPSLIVLDEPELGLHPFALQLLAALMRSASAKTQIIAATQSVTLANQFGWQDLVVVDQVDNASVFRRLQESQVAQWLDQYSLGDLWEKNVLGGTPE